MGQQKISKVFLFFTFRTASHQFCHQVKLVVDFRQGIGKPVRVVFVQKFLFFLGDMYRNVIFTILVAVRGVIWDGGRKADGSDMKASSI